MFSDEAGDMTFKPQADGISRYFTIGTISTTDCSIGQQLAELRRELAWDGTHLNQLHATSDKQWVRDRVYPLIAASDVRFDATILDKPKTQDYYRADPVAFYKLAWYLHFKYVAREVASETDELLVVASSSQIQSKKKAAKNSVGKAMREVVEQVDPGLRWEFAFTPAYCDPCLQAADYLNWAVQRKYDRGDPRSHELVAHLIKSEYQPFQNGQINYY